MSITQTADTPTSGPELQTGDADSSPTAAVAAHLLTGDEETPLDERPVVNATAVAESNLYPADFWNYVVQVDHVDEDLTRLVFVRAPDAGAAACRTATWGSNSTLRWAGDSAKTQYTVYEHGRGQVDTPAGGAW